MCALESHLFVNPSMCEYICELFRAHLQLLRITITDPIPKSQYCCEVHVSF